MTKTKLKVLSIFITVSIISLLLLTGPVNAFILGMAISSVLVDAGQPITFTTTVEIEAGELLPIEQLEFYIFGRKNISCTFYPNGTIISGCEGMSIEPISIPELNYGYGYTYKEGMLTHNITLDTTGYPGGVYETDFRIISNGETFFKKGAGFMVAGAVSEIKRCSVRAKEGELTVNEITYHSNRNKFNFKIPLAGSANGGGYLISQHNRERITYRFYTETVLENTDEILIALVSGRLRLDRDRNSEVEENAILYLDKVNEKVFLFGDTIYANDMELTFIRGC